MHPAIRFLSVFVDSSASSCRWQSSSLWLLSKKLRRLSTRLGTEIFEITRVIIISAKRVFGVFGIYRFQKYFIGAIFWRLWTAKTLSPTYKFPAAVSVAWRGVYTYRKELLHHISKRNEYFSSAFLGCFWAEEDCREMKVGFPEPIVGCLNHFEREALKQKPEQNIIHFKKEQNWFESYNVRHRCVFQWGSRDVITLKTKKT